MTLKRKYSKREEIPVELAGHYIERDGAFVLDAEADPRVDEMRATSIATLKELKDWKERFAGIDPDEVRKLASEKARLEEEQRLKDGKFQEVMTEKLKAALSPVVAERDAANVRLSAMLIDQAVLSEATKRGLRPTAIPDITARARQAFKLVDGVPQAFEADGKTPRMGSDAVTPMNLAEWVDALGTDAPHLFAANAGGGAAGSSSGGAGNRSVVNPFRKETLNITEQMRLTKTDPALAARLEAAAAN